jgi:hypothetical protein
VDPAQSEDQIAALADTLRAIARQAVRQTAMHATAGS